VRRRPRGPRSRRAVRPPSSIGDRTPLGACRAGGAGTPCLYGAFAALLISVSSRSSMRTPSQSASNAGLERTPCTRSSSCWPRCLAWPGNPALLRIPDRQRGVSLATSFREALNIGSPVSENPIRQKPGVREFLVSAVRPIEATRQVSVPRKEQTRKPDQLQRIIEQGMIRSSFL
jgi:hypothetical protein